MLLLGALVLTGCATPTPMPTAPPAPSDSPVFASDEEALAAAEEAYGRYSRVADQILVDGGADPERLKEFVSDEIYATEEPGFLRFASKGWHGVGETYFTLTLQHYDDRQVVVYSCDDVSETDVLDSAGVSVVKPDRTTLIPFEVTFDVEDSMRIVGSDVWTGGGVC